MKRAIPMLKMQWKDNNDIKSCDSIQLCKIALNSIFRTRLILISKQDKRRKKHVKILRTKDKINHLYKSFDVKSVKYKTLVHVHI